MKSINVDGVDYYPKSEQGNIRIVILQRGWNMIGRFTKNGSDCVLDDAKVIRRWGTKKGLGELAEKGPLTDTKLDPCNGTVEFDYLTVVATINANEEAWKKEL